MASDVIDLVQTVFAIMLVRTLVARQVATAATLRS
jgi:hypothetical protein